MVAEICCAGGTALGRRGLQWGRDQLVAEMVPAPARRAEDVAASMGPRPIGRGNGFPWAPNSRRRQASMGPRPIGRGNNLPSRRQRQHLSAASMGPRPIGRGNMLRRSAVVVPPVSLQWGRDQLVAEMQWMPRFSWSARGFNGAATNWSRKSAAAVLRRRVRLELQWGRDQLVAEMRTPACSLSSAATLQWGRDQLVAEIAAAARSAR